MTRHESKARPPGAKHCHPFEPRTRMPATTRYDDDEADPDNPFDAYLRGLSEVPKAARCKTCGELEGEDLDCKACARLRAARNGPDEQTQRALARGTQDIDDPYA